MVIPSQLRLDFPEFTDSTKYPDSGLQFYLDFAYRMLNADRFRSNLDMAAELFAAHFIVLESQAQLSSASGSIPGLNSGIMSSKSVDVVSVSYDTGAGIEQGAGHWNLTTYGTRLMWMFRIFGAGGIQIGVGASPPYAGLAWGGFTGTGYI